MHETENDISLKRPSELKALMNRRAGVHRGSAHGIDVEEKAANHALSELARSRSNNEALGECASTDFFSDGKEAKSWNGRRGNRPVGAVSSRFAPRTRSQNHPCDRPEAVTG